MFVYFNKIQYCFQLKQRAEMLPMCADLTVHETAVKFQTHHLITYLE